MIDILFMIMIGTIILNIILWGLIISMWGLIAIMWLISFTIRKLSNKTDNLEGN